MISHRDIWALAIGICCMTVGSAEPARAAARDRASFNLQLHHLAPGPTGFLATESGEVSGHLDVSAGFAGSYARDALSVRPPTATAGTGNNTLVENRFDLSVLGSIGLLGVAELGVAFPLTYQTGSGRVSRALGMSDASPNLVSQGDVRLVPKLKVLDVNDGAFAVALFSTVVLPSAAGAPYVGEAGPVVAPALAISTRAATTRWGVVAGYRARKRTGLPSLPIDDELYGALAAAYDLRSLSDAPMEIVVELHGHVPARVASRGLAWVTSNAQRARSFAELDVGLRAALSSSVVMSVGAGGGLSRGYGSPAPRIFASLSYQSFESARRFGSGQDAVIAAAKADQDGDGLPDALDGCVAAAEDLDGFQDDDGCPDPDNDGDLVVDAYDGCPLSPEDRDGFEDADGCQDPDNDADGIRDNLDLCPMVAEDADGVEDADGCPEDNDGDAIADAFDECPMAAEDRDGFQDEDGCPDEDNDGDTVADALDVCPAEAEDQDGFEDEDGCPDVDNDQDGIVDTSDVCPLDPESYNAVADGDGCPERGARNRRSLVHLTDEKVEYRGRMRFESGTAVLARPTRRLLKQVASLLKNHTQITKVRIEAHTAMGVSEARNLSLSTLQAYAVAGLLAAFGVESTRLEPVGYGSMYPVVRGRGRCARRMNARVELVIAARDGREIQRQRPPPGQVVSDATSHCAVQRSEAPRE